MDALEFLEAKTRMCKQTCEKCELWKSDVEPSNLFCHQWMGANPEKAVAFVEKWAAEHPIKTRQSVFLEQFPNVRLDTNEIIDISPCRVDPKQYPFNGKDCCKFRSCSECRREFWMQEVEE